LRSIPTRSSTLKKRGSEGPIIRIVIATGISSVVTQLYTIREFLSQFEGNEYVIAIILFNWLILGGAGTWLAHVFTGHGKRARATSLGWLTICLSLLPVIQILAIRVLRDVVFIRGSSVGFYPTVLFSFFTIAPYALIIGYVLPLSLFVLRRQRSGFPGTRIYIIDNIGDVSGGVLFSFFLVYLTTPLTALFLVNIVLCGASWLLFFRLRVSVVGASISAVLVFFVSICGVLVEKDAAAFHKGDTVFYKESLFGRIVVSRDSGLYTLFVDGKPVSSSQDEMMAQEAVHFGLSQVDKIESILLISAQGSMMEEVEKYQPQTIDYVELDPEIISAAFDCGIIKKMKGMSVISGDARAYLKNSGRLYDAIIMSLPEPGTFQLNRLYTHEFFSLAKSRIYPGGILSMSLEGFDNYITGQKSSEVSCLYNTARSCFKEVAIFPGQRIFFICSDSTLSYDIPSLLRKKKIKADYISDYFYGNLTPSRIGYLRDSIDDSIPLNKDLSPYMMRLVFSGWFLKYSTNPYIFYTLLAGLACIYIFRIRGSAYVLFTTGCAVMGSEILVIFLFQILFGYIYVKIGIIVTIFLTGLLPGAWYGDRLARKGRGMFIITDALFIACMTALIVYLKLSNHAIPELFVYVFAFFVSVLCGFQFPIALHLGGDDSAAVTGSFSADLIGAAFGALVVSACLIPYAGIIGSASALIVLKLSSIMAVSTHGKDK